MTSGIRRVSSWVDAWDVLMGDPWALSARIQPRPTITWESRAIIARALGEEPPPRPLPQGYRVPGAHWPSLVQDTEPSMDYRGVIPMEWRW